MYMHLHTYACIHMLEPLHVNSFKRACIRCMHACIMPVHLNVRIRTHELHTFEWEEGGGEGECMCCAEHVQMYTSTRKKHRPTHTQHTGLTQLSLQLPYIVSTHAQYTYTYMHVLSYIHIQAQNYHTSLLHTHKITFLLHKHKPVNVRACIGKCTSQA